jgi:hypothetical protein
LPNPSYGFDLGGGHGGEDDFGDNRNLIVGD